VTEKDQMHDKVTG